MNETAKTVGSNTKSMPALLFWIPIQFILFWFIEAPKGLVLYFLSFNKACSQLFSLPLFVRTFFKPLKNEYREGLVGFSIGAGILIKSVFIIAGLTLLSLLLIAEIVFMIAFMGFPVFLVRMLFP